MGKPLLDQILSTDNMLAAFRTLNGGGVLQGIGAFTVKDAEDFSEETWAKIRHKIWNHDYVPEKMVEIEVPGPRGTTTKVMEPALIDKLIQQAICQLVVPLCAPNFSANCYGVRQGKKIEDAAAHVLRNINMGMTSIVEVYMGDFMRSVPNEELIMPVDAMLGDLDTEFLIATFLETGLMQHGGYDGKSPTKPLALLVANIFLTDMDKEMEKRGLSFVRFGDACLIFASSEAAARKAQSTMTPWIERKLGVKGCTDKTRIVTPMNLKYIGQEFFKDQSGKNWVSAPVGTLAEKAREKQRTQRKRRY